MVDERDSGSVQQIDGQEDPATSEAKYEPPRLTPLGNARDLLAGTTGTKFDGATLDQSLP